MNLVQVAREKGCHGHELPAFSALTVTVPGAAAAWEDTVREFGSGKVTLAQVAACSSCILRHAWLPFVESVVPLPESGPGCLPVDSFNVSVLSIEHLMAGRPAILAALKTYGLGIKCMTSSLPAGAGASH